MNRPIRLVFGIGVLAVLAVVTYSTFGDSGPKHDVPLREERPLAREFVVPPASDLARPIAKTPPPPKLLPLPDGERTFEATIRGKLVDAKVGAPVPQAIVWWRSEGKLNSVLSNGQGEFALSGFWPRGRVAIRIEKGGGYLDDYAHFDVQAGVETVELGVLRVLRGDWNARFQRGPRGSVGINHSLREGKVYITGVRPGTSAERAALKVGERIVAVDGTSIDGFLISARSFLLMGTPGSKVTLVLEGEGGQRRSVVLTRSARSES